MFDDKHMKVFDDNSVKVDVDGSSIKIVESFEDNLIKCLETSDDKTKVGKEDSVFDAIQYDDNLESCFTSRSFPQDPH